MVWRLGVDRADWIFFGFEGDTSVKNDEMKSRLRPCIAVLAALIGCSALFGMTTGPADDPLKTMDSSDADYIRKHLPGVVQGPVADIPPLRIAEDWYPLQEIEFEFERVKSNGKKAKLVLEKIQLQPGGDAKDKKEGWAIELPTGTTRYLDTLDEGGIVAPTDLAKSYGIIIRLDPPEPIVQEMREHNKPITHEIDVKIYGVSDPTSVSHSGSVKCTWTDLGGWRVKVPMGTFDTHLIRIEYNGSIGPASVTAKKYMFIAKGVGPVAFTDSREISAFFFYNNDTDHTGVLSKVTRKK